MCKGSCFFGTLIVFIIGGLVGAGITYHVAKCGVQQTSIQLKSNAQTGPGITITKTGQQ